MAELETLERLLKERDKINLYLRLLNGNEQEIQLLKELLEQDAKSLSEAIEAK